MASRTRSKRSRRSPENRRLSGDFGYKKIDPSVGRSTQFKPGQSGNPGGRPRKLPLSEELLALLETANPRGVTLAREIAKIIVKKAINGDIRFVNLLFERVEGPAVQVHRVGGDEDAPPVNLNVRDAHERLAQIIARIKARQAQTQQ